VGIRFSATAVCGFLLWCMVPHLSAQIKIFTNIGADEGLCQSHVFCMLQDRDGYMWFGTYDGVSRWDGQHFYNFLARDGLASSSVFCMGAAEDGTIYFGTDKGVSAYRDGHFFFIPELDSLRHDMISALLPAHNGALYLALPQKGLYLFQHGKLGKIQPPEGDFRGRLSALHEAHDGTIYIATLAGVYRQRQGVLSAVREFPKGRYSDVWEGPDSTLYVGSVDSGLYILDKSGLRHIGVAQGLSDSRVYSVRTGPGGIVLVTTFGGGVNIIHGQEIEILTEKNGLAHNNVFSCLVSTDGTMFFGTVAGVSLYHNSLFEVYNKKAGLTNNYVVSALADRDDAFYFGTYGSGVDLVRRGNIRNLSTRDGLGDDHVNAIVRFGDELLFGTWRGLYSYSCQTIRPWKYNSFLKHRHISHMMVSRDRALWIATPAAVTIFNDAKTVHLTEKDGLLTADQDYIYEGRDGTIYMASKSGVQTWHNGRVDTLAGAVGFVVHTLYETDRGQLLIGTDNGLLVRDQGRYTRIVQGLTHPSIYGIVADESGRLYLATQRGITVLDTLRESAAIRSLRFLDGLASDECSENACLRDSKGRLWFGSIRGVTCYDPRRIIPTSRPPAVHIKRFRLFEQDYSVEGSVRDAFQHDQNYFKFDFVGINYTANHKVRYRYRMWGVDPKWVETRQTFVQYTNLNDGAYRFQVMARNESGPWSVPATLAFTIRPPFWETWWFISLAVLLGASSVAGIVTLRYQHLLSIERLRTRIAADLHDRVGSGLTEISILSEVHAKSGDRAAEMLVKVGNIAKGLLDNMSDIVWLINPRQDSLLDLLIRLKDGYEDVLSSLGITLHTEHLKSVESVHLSMEYRQNLYLIMKEAINNCLKHSQCRQISLEAQVQNRLLSVTLRDDGRGFCGERNDKGNGLFNMQHRAAVIGGSLQVLTGPGQGTVVQFTGKV
jgi:signal transduction histidine kinase/ligand-binding sensor domain-containing protein